MKDDELAAQAEVARAAFRFVNSVFRDGDLRAAWSGVDPDLRQHWVGGWVELVRQEVEADGYDPFQVMATLAEEDPRHPLWPYFSSSIVRMLHHAIGASESVGPEEWEIGANVRILGVDTELLYLHKTAETAETWEPDTYRVVVPIVMRYHEESGWRVPKHLAHPY